MLSLPEAVFIHSTIETPRRGSGYRRVLATQGTTQKTVRLYDVREGEASYPDVVDVATYQQIRVKGENE